MTAWKVTVPAKMKYLIPNLSLVFTKEVLSNLPHNGKSSYPSMDNIEVSEKGVFKLLQNLWPNKATRPDSEPAIILKTCKRTHSNPNINLPMISRYWACAIWLEGVWMVSIFKKGDEQQPETTDQSLSLLEHIVHSSVMKYFFLCHIS